MQAAWSVPRPRRSSARATLHTRCRSWVTAAGLALLVAACGGGGGSSPAPTPEPPAARPQALATARSGELLAWARGRLAARTPTGTGALAPAWLTTTFSPAATVSASGTVVQEAQVDEEDLIKTDGTRLYTLQPLASTAQAGAAWSQLDVHTLDAGGRPQRQGTVKLLQDAATWVSTRGLQLAAGGPRLAVVGEGAQGSPCPPDALCTALVPYVLSQPSVQLNLVDATQAAAPTVVERWQIDGRLVGTRLVGRTLYVVATHTPQLPYDVLPASASATQRQAALDQMTLAQLLPMLRVNGGAPQPLVAETDCWVQTANKSTQVAITTITAVDLGSNAFTRTSRCFAGGAEALYLSAANLWLATSRWDYGDASGRVLFAPDVQTDIHQFALEASGISYLASGSVIGHLGWDRERTSYRLSEWNGDLRVLSFTGTQGWVTLSDAGGVAASPATLTVLRPRASDHTLQPVATLPSTARPAALGKPGEQVYAVRFVGDRGYVVTFRRTDPLYVLDLSVPTDPRIAGELNVPGFSDWLFPLDGGLLFGVGQEADAQGLVQGVKVALFDVRDASRPALLDSRRYGVRGSSTALSSSAHGLSMQVNGSRTRLALPMLVLDTELLPPRQTVQRFEVDTVARTLAEPEALALGSGWADLSTTRTLLLGTQLHLLRDGTLQSWSW